MNKIILAGMVSASLLMGGCATQLPNSNQFTSTQSNKVVHTSYGVVEAVRPVQIVENTSGIGMGTGAIAGGVLGSKIGNGRGNILGAIAGAIGGGVIGQTIEKAISKNNGVEITLRMEDTNKLITIREKTDEKFAVGDRVKLMGTSGEDARVTH
ncbi:glycine zipper 2TM domain-containing protein [Burkholderia cepacia]|uniref:glycine zipper 2TM domain-containing protein n=1 Tax=Burkholderia cepacia TaxID=292 RepID=UPI00158D1F1F|nr:glycine zipper 2TM domain-containing protein [Burkholderia cepacia]